MKQFITSLVACIFCTTGVFSQIHVDSLGNVGIGVDTPSTQLDVNGVIQASGGNPYTRSGLPE